jgi:MraZ protein
MFRGRHSHTIDAKGRVSIPAAYRMGLQQRSDQPAFLTADENCLRLYPFQDWCDHERKIVGQAELDPEARDYARLVISGAVEAPIDKQGRILVPQYLREHAHLEREVTIAGVGHTVEIWDAARFEVNLNQTRTSLRSIQTGMAEKVGS